MFFPCIFPCKLTLRFSQERVLKLKSWRKQTSLKIQFYSNNCLKQDKNPKKLHMTRSNTHWLFENSMRFQWSCIKMEIHRCISGLIEQQSRGGGWALRWRHVTVLRKRDRRQDQGLINWSREDRTQWKGETWGKGRAERLEMGIKGVDADSTGRDNDPGGLGDMPDSQSLFGSEPN